MAEEKKEPTANNKKTLIIGVSIGIGILILALLIWSAAVSSQYSVFNDNTYKISIKYPSNWSVAKGYQGTLVTFVSPKDDALDVINENLNIVVTDLSANPMTLDQYTQLAIKQMNAVFEKNIETVESKPITFAGFPAYLYVINAPKPDGLSIKVIWFIKDNRAYTITCLTEILRAQKHAGHFNEMLNSFSVPSY